MSVHNAASIGRDFFLICYKADDFEKSPRARIDYLRFCQILAYNS